MQWSRARPRARPGARTADAGAAAVRGAARIEMAALDLGLPVRLLIGAAVGALAVTVGVVLDLSPAWSLLPPLVASVAVVEFIGVRAAIVTTAVAALGTVTLVLPPAGIAVSGPDGVWLSVYLLSAACIVAMGGRLRNLAQQLLQAARTQGAQQAQLEATAATLEATWARLEALTDVAPVGICLVDLDMTFVMVNQELARLNKLSVEEHIGRPVTVVRAIDAQAVEAFRSVLAGGPPIRDRELSNTDLVGAANAEHVLASWFAVRDRDGTVIGAGGLVQDVTRRKVAEERLWLLAELSDMLEEPLDAVARARSLAALMAPRLADLCLVVMPDDSGRLRIAGIGTSDPARGVLAADVFETYPEAVERSTTLASALAGETVVDNHFSPASVAVSPSHLEALRGLGLTAVVAIPIVAAGRAHGVVLLGKFTPSPCFAEGEVAYASTIVARAAIALENAQLYERMSALRDQEYERAELLGEMEVRQRHIADTLQRSLLPDALPELPSLALASAFRPAGLGVEVGGDTFDLFDADAAWVAYVADVCGKGPSAAARTGLVRYTMRAEANHDDDPVELLRRVNAAMLLARREDDAAFATMLVVTLRRRADGGLDAVVATGGHPAPVLLHDGVATEISVEGTVVGAFAEASFRRTSLTMRPGDLLLLYTDGVTEARRATRSSEPPDLFGEDRLRAALEQAWAAGVTHAQGLVDAVVAQIDLFADAGLRDDLAILALQVLPAVPVDRPTTQVGVPTQRPRTAQTGSASPGTG